MNTIRQFWQKPYLADKKLHCLQSRCLACLPFIYIVGYLLVYLRLTKLMPVWRCPPPVFMIVMGRSCTRYFRQNRAVIVRLRLKKSLSIVSTPLSPQRTQITTKHAGVDLAGILRAIRINVEGGEVLAGGSTITQQTARLLLLDPQQQATRTLQRKLKEMVLAVQLHSTYSKNDVLALYLNQVYFGNLAYGIDGAARVYFHKSAPELSLAECALLAGIVQNAILNDPLTNFEGAKERQHITLGLMVNNGFITQVAADRALPRRITIWSDSLPD